MMAKPMKPEQALKQAREAYERAVKKHGADSEQAELWAEAIQDLKKANFHGF